MTKIKTFLATDQNNDCVHCLDREGQLIQLILTEKQVGWTGYRNITVDKEAGLLWVGS